MHTRLAPLKATPACDAGSLGDALTVQLGRRLESSGRAPRSDVGAAGSRSWPQASTKNGRRICRRLPSLLSLLTITHRHNSCLWSGCAVLPTRVLALMADRRAGGATSSDGTACCAQLVWVVRSLPSTHATSPAGLVHRPCARRGGPRYIRTNRCFYPVTAHLTHVQTLLTRHAIHRSCGSKRRLFCQFCLRRAFTSSSSAFPRRKEGLTGRLRKWHKIIG